MLNYGTYLAYVILSDTLQSSTLRRSEGTWSREHWSKGKSWSQYSRSWGWAFTQDVRVGSVGLLAMMTAPLAWGLFWYHLYLIWAGMTTNESGKWADWRDDIADGLVFRADRNIDDGGGGERNTDIEPFVEWPISSTQQLVRSDNGRSPEAQPSSTGTQSRVAEQYTHWRRVKSLEEVDNLYDLGFWDNLTDVLSK